MVLGRSYSYYLRDPVGAGQAFGQPSADRPLLKKRMRPLPGAHSNRINVLDHCTTATVAAVSFGMALTLMSRMQSHLSSVLRNTLI